MSRRFSAEWLDEITSAPMYLRRCNGLPEQGIRISGAGLRAILACVTDVTTRDDRVIVWRGPSGEFTAEPVGDRRPGQDRRDDAGLPEMQLKEAP